jgi:hypothetical protein
MTNEVEDIREVEVSSQAVVEETTVTGSEPVIDWDAAPATGEVVDSTVVATAAPPVQTYAAPRGPWDFTNSQRIILALLIWLNLLMLAVGYLAITGQIRI